jgi:hypothetical protein
MHNGQDEATGGSTSVFVFADPVIHRHLHDRITFLMTNAAD